MNEQLAIQFPNRHGGKREGAGRQRPKGAPRRVGHKRRPEVNWRHPQHVVMHVVEGLDSLRTGRMVRELEAAIARSEREGFRVVHWSVLGTHLHMLVEADSARALSKGMHGLAIRLARAVNRVQRRKGTVFADHYYARPVTTPTDMRNTLRYVVDNHELHALRAENPLRGDKLDPFSSLAHPALPAPPRTWLLRVGWLRAKDGPELRGPVRAAIWRLHSLTTSVEDAADH